MVKEDVAARAAFGVAFVDGRESEGARKSEPAQSEEERARKSEGVRCDAIERLPYAPRVEIQ